MATQFRSLPSVDSILSDQRVQRLVEEYSHQAVLDLVRSRLENVRKTISQGLDAPDFDEVVRAVEESATVLWHPWPEPVINATGVILHTNLGRAPLSREAMDAVAQAGGKYSGLELDLETGRRGSRQEYVARLLCQLTGAEAAMAVNNNASGVLLGLAAMARGKEVIVSRGEAIEIGGGFRIPGVLRQSGADLVEVGTTNRTYVRDFQNALSDRTGAILSVHASNFRVMGFTHAPEIGELVALGKSHQIPVLHDLGSGCLLDTTQFGLAQEPMPQESLKAGVTLAFISGDKLLGGPQAGIVLGNQDAVATLSRHPLARAVRIDKLSMAALTATLLHYVRDEATQKIPVWRMVATSEEELKARAERWNAELGHRATVARSESTIGGGSLPGEVMPTWVLCVDAEDVDGGAQGIAGRLRHASPPVIGRIEEERVLLDPRTVLPEEDAQLLMIVGEVLPSA